MLKNHLELCEQVAEALAECLEGFSLSFETYDVWNTFPIYNGMKGYQIGWEAYAHIVPPDYDDSWDAYFKRLDDETGENLVEPPIHTLEVTVTNPYGSPDFTLECYLMREDDERIKLGEFAFLGDKLNSEDWSYLPCVCQSIMDVLNTAYTMENNEHHISHAL